MARNDLVTEDKSNTTSLTLSAGATGSRDINISKTGYTPLGIMTFGGSGTSSFAWADWYFTDNNTARVYCRNISGSSATLNSVTVKVLYMKNR